MCEAETTLVATSSRSVNTSVWPSQQEGRSLKQQQTNRTFVAATGFRVVTSPPASPPHPHPSHTILALSKHQILLYFCFNHLSFRCTILDFFFLYLRGTRRTYQGLFLPSEDVTSLKDLECFHPVHIYHDKREC